MSGTPVRNRFQNWWPVMRFLWPELSERGQVADRSYYRWLEDHMRWDYDHFSQNHKKYVSEKQPGSLVAQMPSFIQHFRRQNCCEFHPKGFLRLAEPQVVKEIIELLPAQVKAIHEMEDRYLTWLGDNPMVASIDIVAQTRIRQLTLGVPTVSQDGEVGFAADCQSPKLDRLLEILTDLDGDAAVVFTSSQKFASVVTERLNAASFAAFEWSGKIKQSERNRRMTEFQAGKWQVAVVSIAAGGTGVSGFQKVAATEIWLDRDTDPTNNLQAEARLDRIGQERQVQRFELQDSLGYDAGRLNDHLLRQLELNRSNRRTA